MKKLVRIALVPAILAAFLLGAVPAFADNVCPVIGGPNNPSIHGTPAEVPDMDGNPAHGSNPANPSPGDVFWN